MDNVCPRCRNPFPLHWKRHVSNYSTPTKKYLLCGHCIHEEELEIQSSDDKAHADHWRLFYNRTLDPLPSGVRGNVFVYFRVTVPGADGCIDNVRVNRIDLVKAKSDAVLRITVAHAAWCKLYEERDPETGERYDSNHARALKKVISQLGAEKAFLYFARAIQFEETARL